jgi:hypothetical protein
MFKDKKNWTDLKKICLQYYLQAFHVYHFFDEDVEAELIKKHLEEEFQWVDID